MGFLRWIIGFLTAVIVVLFALGNRHIITLNLLPAPVSLDLPLYAIGLGFLLFGFILGAITVWLNMAPLRRTKRAQSRTIKTLEKQLKAVNQNTESDTKALTKKA